MLKSLTALLSTASLLAAQEVCQMPAYLGSFSHQQAAFLDVLPNGQGGSDLFISSFTGMPFRKGSISRVQNIQHQITSREITSIKSSPIDPSVTWPNGVKPIPEHVYIEGAFSEQRVISCGGFLVPSHGNGACIVYDIDVDGNVQQFELARAGRSKFFHQAAWYDVDGDGFDDLITAKASKGFFGGSTGALYWYKNPGSSKRGAFRAQRWQEQKMFDGPDVHFELVDLNQDSIPEIIATQFFSEKMTVNWLKEGSAFGSGPQAWEQRVVVDDLSFLFNMSFVDLNHDGHEEIVLTNHVTDPALAGVYAIEIPTDFKTGAFKQHMLQNDFPTLNSGPGQASPGGAVPFQVNGETMFAVSGDGNQKAYIMCKSEGDAWAWTRQELLDTGNTVGAIAIGDVTGDGKPELFVPSYEKGEIHVYSYSY